MRSFAHKILSFWAWWYYVIVTIYAILSKLLWWRMFGWELIANVFAGICFGTSFLHIAQFVQVNWFFVAWKTCYVDFGSPYLVLCFTSGLKTIIDVDSTWLFHCYQLMKNMCFSEAGLDFWACILQGCTKWCLQFSQGIKLTLEGS